MPRSTALPGPLGFWLQSSPSCDFTPARPRLLLDLPPPEVRLRIASLVSAGTQTTHLLALARTNPIQRAAVVAALRHRMILPTFLEPNELARWIEVFVDDVKELVCEQSCLQFVGGAMYPHPVSLCQVSTLRKVTLCDDKNVLEAIQNSVSLREVSVNMSKPAHAALLLQTLRTLRLTSLELVCELPRGEACPFRNLLALHSNGHTIAGCCPNLRAFYMRCDNHPDRDNPENIVWRNLPDLCRLEAVALHGNVPDEMLPLLKPIRSVRIHDTQQKTFGRNLLREMASRLTTIQTNDCFVEAHRTELAKCVSLEELSTTVRSGSELALGQALNGMKKLCTLVLEWEQPTDEFGMIVHEGGEPQFVSAKDLGPLIVENALRVEELRLRKARISAEDVVSILRLMGRRVKVLEVEMIEQEEEPLEQLERLLEEAMVHCPGLRRLQLGCKHLFPSRSSHKDRLQSGWPPVESPTKQIAEVIRRLYHRIPMLVLNVSEILSFACPDRDSLRRKSRRRRRHVMPYDFINNVNDSD